MNYRHCIYNILVVRCVLKKVNHQDKMCVFFHNNDVDNDTLLPCVERHTKMEEEGSAANYFVVIDAESIVMTEVVEREDECEVVMEMPSVQGLKEDIVMLRIKGYGVNNDNDPALENTSHKKRKKDELEPMYSGIF